MDKNNKAAKMLRYSKKINGTYYVVEAVPENKYKKVWVVSAYISKTKEDTVTQAPDVKIPRFNARDELASPVSSNNSLSQNKAAVNNGNMLENVNNDNIKYQSRNSDIDSEYLEAVENNDLETAQKLVEEAAKKAGYNSNSDYQGTSAFNGSAPSLNGYFESKEERIAAWKNGDFEDTQTLGDFVDGIDIGDLEFALFDNRNYRNADTATKESIYNLRNVINNQNNKVIMYRSVPNSVKENRFRNGDWISPSYLYAVENARIHGWVKIIA